MKRRPDLFSRLLSYFLICMAIPILVLMVSYLTGSNANLVKSLQEQASYTVSQNSAELTRLIERLRHDAYEIAKNPVTIDTLNGRKADSKELSDLLFKTIAGDASDAQVHVLDSTATTRLSTGEFPEEYDLRTFQARLDPRSPLNMVHSLPQSSSLLTVVGRPTDGSNPIICTIVRRVYDDKGVNCGYVIVELLGSALGKFLFPESILNEELLYDKSVPYYLNLKQPQLNGDPASVSDLRQLSQGKLNYRTDQSVVVSTPLLGTNLFLVGLVNITPYQKNIRHLLAIVVVAILLGTALSVVLALVFSRSISHPIQDLMQAMMEVEKGNLQSPQLSSDIKEFRQMEASFKQMVAQIVHLLALTKEEEAKVIEAERKALESQMKPHFLFNTLNTIKALARIHNEEEIYQISLKLGKLLRSTVDNHDSLCTVRESMEMVDSYLTIQNIRFGDRLHVEEHMDEAAADCVTPKLIIQPMVENAIGHGLEPKSGDWHLKVSATVHAGMLTITIKDDGVGIPEGVIPPDLDDLENSGHVGLYNAYRRIKLQFQDEGQVHIDSVAGSGTTVTMTMPAVTREQIKPLI